MCVLDSSGQAAFPTAHRRQEQLHVWKKSGRLHGMGAFQTSLEINEQILENQPKEKNFPNKDIKKKNKDSTKGISVV